MLAPVLADNGAPPVRITDDLLIGDDLTVGDLIAAVRADISGAFTAGTLNGVQILGGAAIPSAGAGVAHSGPALYFRTGTLEVYYPTGAGAMQWALVIQATGVVAAATTSVDGAAAKAATDAASSAATASVIMKRDANADVAVHHMTGTAQKLGALALGRDRGIFMPAPGGYEDLIGYVPAAVFPMQESAHGSLRDAVANQDLAAVNGVSTYNKWVKGYRGVYVPSDAFGWAANLYAPANANWAMVTAFSAAAHKAEDIGIAGYKDGGAGSTGDGVVAYVATADDKVKISINDGTLSGSLALNQAITFGDVYVLCVHVNRTTGFLYATLINVTTGVVTTAVPLDISAYNTIVGGGATPLFQVGWIDGVLNGTGVQHFGLAIHTAGIAAVDVAAKIANRLAGLAVL